MSYFKKTKILFISLYNFDASGIRSMSALLNTQGYLSYIVFLKEFRSNSLVSRKELELVFNIIRSLNINIIGVSLLCSSSFKLASVISKEIKNRFKVKIIWGGIHPTICPDESIECCDILCRGEGEDALLELMDAMEMDKETSDIKNMWFKNRKNIIKNDLRLLRENLDTLPMPQYDREKEIYIDDYKIINFKPSVSAMITRGCIFNCTFCNIEALRDVYCNKGNFRRQKSVEKIIKELVLVKDKIPNIKYIWFSDNIFPYDKKYVELFSKEYKKYIDIPFGCEFHAKMVDEGNIALLKKSGLKRAIMGIQSGSEKIRKNIFGRVDMDADIIKAAKIFHKYHLECFYDLISDNPFEKIIDKYRTLKLLFKIPTPFRIQKHTLIFFPKARITKMALENKIITYKDVEGKSVKALSRFNKPNLTFENLLFTSINLINMVLIFPKNKILKKIFLKN